MDVLAMSGLSGEEGFSTWARLRNMLFSLVSGTSLCVVLNLIVYVAFS